MYAMAHNYSRTVAYVGHQREQAFRAHQWHRPEQPAPLYDQHFWCPTGVYDPSDHFVQSSLAEYPESSQRTVLSPSPQYYPTNHQTRSLHSRSPSESAPPLLSNAPLLPALLTPSPAPAPQQATFKIEASEDEPLGFVMEPGTASGDGVLSISPLLMEVPLRATQASGAMRKMMTVFRLNPFAVNNEGRRGGSASSDNSSASSSSESSPNSLEARPLEEEPLIFEFQVQLDRPDLLSPDSDDVYSSSSDDSGRSSTSHTDSSLPTPPPSVEIIDADDSLHAFPPEFQLHKDDPYDSLNHALNEPRPLHWANHGSGSDGTGSLHSWDGGRDVDVAATGHRIVAGFRGGTPKFHATVAHPYIRKSARGGVYHHGQREYPQSSPSPPHHSVFNHVLPRLSHQPGTLRYRHHHHASPPLRMESYLDNGAAPTTAIRPPPLPHRASSYHGMNIPQVSSVFADHGGHENNNAFVGLSAPDSHRRWSTPEAAAPTTHHGIHGHAQIMVPSLPVPVQPYMVH